MGNGPLSFLLPDDYSLKTCSSTHGTYRDYLNLSPCSAIYPKPASLFSVYNKHTVLLGYCGVSQLLDPSFSMSVFLLILHILTSPSQGSRTQAVQGQGTTGNQMLGDKESFEPQDRAALGGDSRPPGAKEVPFPVKDLHLAKLQLD